MSTEKRISFVIWMRFHQFFLFHIKSVEAAKRALVCFKVMQRPSTKVVISGHIKWRLKWIREDNKLTCIWNPIKHIWWNSLHHRCFIVINSIRKRHININLLWWISDMILTWIFHDRSKVHPVSWKTLKAY